MKRRTLALVLGVTLPTVLLAAGWLAASLRERESVRRERLQTLARSADAVRGAVDESLEELRRREDERPFYLYNPVFSPPDVAAVSDPIALSPLADEPEDERIVGYFQVEPGGLVGTPYSIEAGGGDSALGRAVTARVSGEPYAAIRGLASWGEPVVAASSRAPGAEEPELGATVGVPPAEGRGRIVRPRPGARQRADRPGPRPPSRREPRGLGMPDAGYAVPGPVDNPPPQAPLTLTLNPWGQDVLNDIEMAQAGNLEANQRLIERGRQAPVTRRNTVPWEQIQAAPQAQAPPRSARNRLAGAGEGASRQRQAADAPVSPAPAPRRATSPSRRPASLSPPAPGAVPDDGAGQRDPHGIRGGAADVEVDYTPMAWRVLGDDIVLHRLVSHEGATVVQGVILDRRHLLDEWIPGLVRRHSLDGVEPAVISAESDADCSVRRRVSAILPGLELCYPPAAAAAASSGLREGLLLQLAALAALALVVTLAGVTINRAARRAEDLSRQKSAFVSAVSHELRTPLTTIRMHAEMLRDGLVPEAKRERFHDQLVHESVRLSQLVENVLELSRVEEGRRVLELREVDLTPIVSSAIEDLRGRAAAGGVDVVGPSGGEPLVAAVDAPAVSQIVVNLVDNALKYGAGPDGGTVEVSLTRADDAIALAVVDAGPGIPAAERELVFERFHRGENAEKGAAAGTGIGLALVRELARAHGGDARVVDRPAGCEVRVTFPAARG